MSKKTTSPLQKTTLILPKDDFRARLEERIKAGRELLEINVPAEMTGYGSLYPYPSRHNKVSYNEQALKDFKKAYFKWNDYNRELLKQAFNPSENEYYTSYSQCNMILTWGDGDDAMKTYSDTIIREIDELENLIGKLPLIPDNASNSSQTVSPATHVADKGNSGKDVFIVHGHDNELKQTVARVLEKLGLHPIILHEQPNRGYTIIEKLENAANSAGFAVILLTADDLGGTQNDKDLKPRARQNVVFEMGLFIGKIGRNRVMALIDDGVEKPGDLDGMVYTPVDQSDAWKFALVKELREAGYPVSADVLL